MWSELDFLGKLPPLSTLRFCALNLHGKLRQDQYTVNYHICSPLTLLLSPHDLIHVLTLGIEPGGLCTQLHPPTPSSISFLSLAPSYPFWHDQAHFWFNASSGNRIIKQVLKTYQEDFPAQDQGNIELNLDTIPQKVWTWDVNCDVLGQVLGHWKDEKMIKSQSSQAVQFFYCTHVNFSVCKQPRCALGAHSF